MIGFILDFCNKYDIIPTIFNMNYDTDWLEFYRQKYTFYSITSIDMNTLENEYLFILLLTDDDDSFKDEHITNNIVCIDHCHVNRRTLIKHHIPIAAFHDDIHYYAMPIFEYIDYKSKMDIITKIERPIITFLGNSTIPLKKEVFSLIENIDEFDIYIINRCVPWDSDYTDLPNVYFHENISPIEMFTLLLKTTYVCYIPNLMSYNSIFQIQNQQLSASIPIAFTTGCKLILPEIMNRYLKLDSIITYPERTRIVLYKTPSLIQTFIERERLINIRDTTLFNLEHFADLK
jgi:hypothetical protein